MGKDNNLREFNNKLINENRELRNQIRNLQHLLSQSEKTNSEMLVMLKDYQSNSTTFKTKVTNNFGTNLCGNCKSFVFMDDVYCTKCGFKLDWSDVHEFR